MNHREPTIAFAVAPLTPPEYGVELCIVEGIDAAVDWDNIAPHPRLAELAGAVRRLRHGPR